jgi:hypothetical protein
VTARPRTLLPAALIGLVALLLTAPPLGAIWVPQNRQEFVNAVSKGEKGSKMETFVVDRSFDEVYRTLETRTSPCLDKQVERSAYVGYWEHSSSDYNPTLKRLGADRAEFTLQVVHRPRGVGHTPPAGGLYVMAMDLKRAGASRTEVVLYRPMMGFKNISKSLMQWAEGRSTDCPKLK